ncbi:MAG: DUF6510 family protein [Leifsonia sp.]
MTHLDGNALAGPLADIFRFEATTASARCLGCGRVDVLAHAMVYGDAAGMVARCASCDSVLATVVLSEDRMWLSLSGVSAIEMRR